jgi:hypothetical protein
VAVGAAADAVATTMTRPAPLTWLAALTAFAVVLILLSWRMLGGNDPALGAAQPQQAAVPPAKRVIVRRVIRRTVVVTTDAPGAGVPVPAVGGATVATAAPVRVEAAPAAPPAPAPAAVTRSS